MINRILAVLAFADGHSLSTIATLLQVGAATARGWIKRYLLKGVKGLNSRRSPGWPPKLTKAQKRELAKLIKAGPAKAGFIGNVRFGNICYFNGNAWIIMHG